MAFIITSVLGGLLLGGCKADTSQSENPYFRMADRVTADMFTADAWVKPTEKITLTEAEIKAFNEKNKDMITLSEEESTSLGELGDKLTSEVVRCTLTELANDVEGKEGYLNGRAVDSDYWQEQISNADIDGVPEELRIRYGFSVSRSTLRALPCADFIGETAEDLFYDEMLTSECLPFQPLVIAHESVDRAWYFVYMYGFSGWVQKENVAVCPSREDWEARQEPEEFLIVTGREMRLNTDRGSSALSDLLLPMGTKLTIVKTDDAPESIHGRYNYGNYIVRLPVRGAGGEITDDYALIPVTSDVTFGYLPYNNSKVIELAMKRLGDRYGWGGLDNSQDCSGMIREIYSCFGIFLPRSSGEQANISGVERHDLSNLDNDAKLVLLKKLPAGTLLYFPGHIMLYLGMKDNRPYAISAVGSFAPEGMASGTAQSINTVVINDLYIHRRNGKSWIESITAATVIR